jgi:hypothetical protein
VIGWFMLGQGAYLPSVATLTFVKGDVWCTMSPDKKAALNKEFADKFANQIKTLIKHEPRLVKEVNTSYTIYHE